MTKIKGELTINSSTPAFTHFILPSEIKYEKKRSKKSFYNRKMHKYHFKKCDKIRHLKVPHDPHPQRVTVRRMKIVSRFPILYIPNTNTDVDICSFRREK